MNLPAHRLITSILVVLASSAHAAEPDLTEREAKALLAMPKDSVSLGRTSDGALHAAVELPAKGEGYQVLSHALGRKTNYGTRELINAISRATKAVRDQFPGSKLGVGNLGFETGKAIPWSVSHQSGRDGDIGMYATTLEGEPLQMLPFVFYDDSLTASHNGKKVRFDLARNLALVTALVDDDEVRVQYLFVAAWLKAKLLEEARRKGTPAKTIERLEAVMHQPTDSNPHADHFHIRLFCTIEDRQHGCINREPARAWVDLGDEEHAARAHELARIFGLEKPALHIAALEKLAAIEGREALAPILLELKHPQKKVRKAALSALVTIQDPAAAHGIEEMLPTIEDAAWAVELFRAVPELDAESLVPLARRAATTPESLLHASVAKKAEADIQIAGLKVLRDHGTKADVPTVLPLLAHKNKKVASAAREALAWITCQPTKTDFVSWWPQHEREDFVAWAAAGMTARKKKLPTLRSKAGVEALIPMIAASDAAVRQCVSNALIALTDHTDFDPRMRTPGRNRKHWEAWWKDNRAESKLP